MRVRLALIVVILLVTGLAGCSPDDSVNEGGTLTLALDDAPTGFNPYLAQGVPAGQLAELLYAGLLQVTPDGSLRPVLLESIPEVSADGLTYTFRLRPGLKWSDGEPLTATDLLFTIAALQDPQLPSGHVAYWRDRTVEQLDELTVMVTLPAPNPDFLLNEILVPLPKHVLGEVPVSSWVRHASHTEGPSVSSGPFVLEATQPGEQYTLIRNDHYALGAPKLDQVVVRVISDQGAMVNSLLSGEIDFAQVPPELWSTMAVNDQVRGFEQADLGYVYIGYNFGRRVGQDVPFFQDKRVRQAIALAVNQAELVYAATQGRGIPISGPIVPLQAAWYDAALAAPIYDPALAQQLLEEAGWLMGVDGVREKDGVKLHFDLSVRNNKEERVRAAELWARELAAVGIKVDVKAEAFETQLHRINPPHFDYHAILMGWSIGPTPSLSEIFHSGAVPHLTASGDYAGGGNYGSWQNEEADELLRLAEQGTDAAVRRELLGRLQQIFLADPPYYFLWSDLNYYAYTSRLQGPVTPNPWGRGGWGLWWNIEELWLE